MIQTPFRLSSLNVVWVPGGNWRKEKGCMAFMSCGLGKGDKTVPEHGSSLGSSHRDILALMMSWDSVSDCCP